VTHKTVKKKDVHLEDFPDYTVYLNVTKKKVRFCIF